MDTPAKISVGYQVSDGLVTLLPVGQHQYTPNAGYGGQDSIPYKVTDRNRSSDPVTLSFYLMSRPPLVANNALFQVTQGSSGTFASGDLLALAQSATGASPQVTSISLPSNGTLIPNGDGGGICTPAAGFTGTDNVTFTRTDSVNVVGTCFRSRQPSFPFVRSRRLP